jgi:hypothetical protein
MKARYTVQQTPRPPALEADFYDAQWALADKGVVGSFRKESTDHHPEVSFRVLHNGTHLFVRFHVKDRYVRSVQTAYMGPVCTDSCTEFFVRPKPDQGYFNFEVNAGGTLHLSYVEDPTHGAKGFKKWQPVDAAWAGQVTIWHSLPEVVDPEIAEPVEWGNGWTIPVALFEAYVGPLGTLSGQIWHANFYKCGDRTSHPHWAAWSPVPRLNFHLPESFGELIFA